MELTEKIETINEQLEKTFGRDDTTGRVMYRIVLTDDQFEKRLMSHTDTGMELLHPEVREVHKYASWGWGKYVLERLVLVPVVNQSEIPTVSMSYEPLWVFETQLGVALPPRFELCKFTIDAVHAALGKKSMRKYVDEEAQHPVEHRQKRLAAIHEELFGNETPEGDALAYGSGVSLSGPKLEAPSTSPLITEK